MNTDDPISKGPISNKELSNKEINFENQMIENEIAEKSPVPEEQTAEAAVEKSVEKPVSEAMDNNENMQNEDEKNAEVPLCNNESNPTLMPAIPADMSKKTVFRPCTEKLNAFSDVNIQASQASLMK